MNIFKFWLKLPKMPRFCLKQKPAERIAALEASLREHMRESAIRQEELDDTKDDLSTSEMLRVRLNSDLETSHRCEQSLRAEMADLRNSIEILENVVADREKKVISRNQELASNAEYIQQLNARIERHQRILQSLQSVLNEAASCA